MEKDPNSSFNKAFLGTPPTKSALKKEIIIYDELKKKHSRNLPINHAYFRINAYIKLQQFWIVLIYMLIFEPMLILARVRYAAFKYIVEKKAFVIML